MAGEELYRIHAARREARYYGNRDGTWRWDDPNGGYGVLYVGLTQAGPFAETLLRRPAEKRSSGARSRSAAGQNFGRKKLFISQMCMARA